MSEPRLKARLWVHAAIRRCSVLAIPAVVVKSGDPDAGAVLVKLNRGAAGCEVFTQVRDGQGEPAWLRAIRRRVHRADSGRGLAGVADWHA